MDELDLAAQRKVHSASWKSVLQKLAAEVKVVDKGAFGEVSVVQFMRHSPSHISICTVSTILHDDAGIASPIKYSRPTSRVGWGRGPAHLGM
jgi:hypothetical protein